MAEALPSRIGGYDIRRLLGTGTMGDVYHGVVVNAQTKVQEFYAVKVLNTKVAKRLEWCVRFRSEVKDPHLLEYKEIEFDSKYQYYFVADYLEVKAASRAAFRRERSKEILDSFAKVAGALDKAHKKKYIHGNIKTSNLLVRRAEGNVAQAILSDWGLTYVYDKEYFSGERFQSTFPYMSPERIQELVGGVDPKASKLTAAADTYSLTCVLIETLTGQRPFSGCAGLDDLDKAKREQKYLLLNLNFPVRHINIQKLNEIIRKGLQYEAGARFGSAAELAQALEGCKVESKKA